MPQRQHQRDQRTAARWAAAEAEAFGIPIDAAMMARWSRTIRQAGIPFVAAKGPRRACYYDPSRNPRDVAEACTLPQVNHHLRSLSAALWMVELVERPAGVRALGPRIYGPGDCQPVMVDVKSMIDDHYRWRWSVSFGKELCWRWIYAKPKPHAATKLFRRINPFHPGGHVCEY